MFCPNCGMYHGDDSVFCAGCGARLSGEQSAQQPVYQTPVPPPVYQQPYYQPPYHHVPAPDPGKGMGIAGMVLGIISIVLCCGWYISAPCGVVGLIFSIIGAVKSRKIGSKNGCAIAGIVCSAIGLVMIMLYALVIFGFYAELFNAMTGDMGGYYGYY